MKNKKVLSLLGLAVVGSAVASCSKGQVEVLNYSSAFKAEVKEGLVEKGSNVYMDENGQIIKINDPDDPALNVVKELKM